MSGRRKLVLDVLPADITDGRKLDPRRCPVALALSRLPEVRFVDVRGTAAYGMGADGFIKVTMPDAVGVFVARFDKGVRVEPLRCVVELERQ